MPYQRRNNRNKRNHFNKPRVNPIISQARKLFYNHFTFEDYLNKMGSSPEVYSTLFMWKLKAGFTPSREIINHMITSKNPAHSEIKMFLKKNRYLEQMNY